MSSPGLGRASLTLRLRENIASVAPLYKDLAMDPTCYERMFDGSELASAHPLEALEHVRRQTVAELARTRLGVDAGADLAEEVLRRLLLHVDACRPAHDGVG